MTLIFEQDPTGEAATATTCTTCDQKIDGDYFLIADAVVCPRCRRALDTSSVEQTSASRLFGALGYGTLAAAAGALLYFAILYFTGYEFALVAILVGFMVGYAVRAGSRHKGGLAYQLLAVVLTYSAIVVTYMPFILVAMVNEDPAPMEQTLVAEPRGLEAGDPTEAEPTVGDLVAAMAILFLITAASPVLAGVENLMGMAIIAFALYQAWAVNRRPEILGPYQEGRMGPG